MCYQQEIFYLGATFLARPELHYHNHGSTTFA